MEKTTQDVIASPHKDFVKEETGHPPAPNAF